MRLLDVNTMQLKEFVSQSTPPYSILSHTWGHEEVSFQDITAGEGPLKKGWLKLVSCCAKTRSEGLQYTWIDTCCIDKSSSAELSEAINSMFKWYHNAEICYAYLEDVMIHIPSPIPSADNAVIPAPSADNASSPSSTLSSGAHSESDTDSVISSDSDDPLTPTPAIRPNSIPPFPNTTPAPDPFSNTRFMSEFSSSRWFTRGWTLQELLAPSEVILLDNQWLEIGSRTSSAKQISMITGIPQHVLARSDWDACSIAQRLSWSSKRQTTRVEDEAYCLLGLFGVNMPLIYGEGSKAFLRLQEELLRVFEDYSIFAWRPGIRTDRCEHLPVHSGLFAESPSFFKDAGGIKRCTFPLHFRSAEAPQVESQMPRLFCEVKPQVVELHLPLFGPFNALEIAAKVDWTPPPMLPRMGYCRRFTLSWDALFAVAFLNCAGTAGRVGMVLTFNTKRQVFERSHCPSLIFASETNGQAGMYMPKRIAAFSGSEFHYKPLGITQGRKPMVIRMVGMLQLGYTAVIPDKRTVWKLDKASNVHIAYDPRFLLLKPAAWCMLPPILLQWSEAGGMAWETNPATYR
ncbi:hypothetical protein MFIFM68171_07987 [Madurella fahalii]|uniref:Heterokaryon incompatibility domain-containing protein n=1 Tax=Madurella fahalii TaxID=1157608 RepID=A0ABQ0GJ27_9PEZI